MRKGFTSVAVLLLVLLSASALAAPLEDQRKAQNLADFVKNKVSGVVGAVKHRIGDEWGSAKVTEAEARLPGNSEIEYVRIKGTGGTGSSGTGYESPISSR